MKQTKQVLLLALGFMVVGLFVIFLTHSDEIPNDNLDVRDLVSYEKYVDHIEPWLKNVYLDQSLDSISQTKDNLLNFKGSDRSIGPAHLSLFLAFDAWERFLLSGDSDDRQISLNHFEAASNFLPELSSKIEILENILKEQNA